MKTDGHVESGRQAPHLHRRVAAAEPISRTDHKERLVPDLGVFFPQPINLLTVDNSNLSSG